MLHLLLALGLSLAPTVLRDGADEQYQFVARLCDQGHYELAVREARKFLEQHPRHARAELTRYRLASALFELERPAEAVPHYEQLVKRAGFEYAAESWLRLGQCELQLDEPEKARVALARALASDQDYLHGAAGFFLAEAEFALGAWSRAEARYAAALDTPAAAEYHPHALRGLAWSQFRLAEYEACARSARDFLARYERHELTAELSFLLGDALYEAGDGAAAERAWSDVAAGPFRAAALRGRAFARSTADDPEAAAALFGELLELEPRGRFAREAALQRGAQLLRAGHPRAALGALAHPALEGSPEELYWTARALAASGERERALATYERAATGAAPELAARIASARGDLLYELGRLEESTAAYGQAGSDYALHAAATAELAAGDARAATELARSFLERYPRSPYRDTTRLVLAEALFAREEFGAAREVFGELLADAPELGRARRARCQARIAWCAYRSGDLEAAARAFELVNERFAGDEQGEEARFMQGRARLESGDERGAVQAWKLYLSEYPSAPRRAEVELALSRLEQGTARLERLLASDAPRELKARATYELAEKLAEAGRREEALAAYAHFVKSYPRHELLPRARYGYAWALREDGRPAEATHELDVLLLACEDAQLTTSAAELAVWTSAESGEASAALAAWTRYAALVSDPDARLAALRVTARALAAAGDDARAEALLAGERGASDSPTVRAELDVERAWVALDAGHVERAEACVAGALELDARHAGALEAAFFVGEARFEAGSWRSAAELYARAALTDGELADDSLYKLGFALLREAQERPARLRDAAAAFEALVERYPDSELLGESLFLWGECLYRSADYERAAACFARLREELPRHEVRPKALFRLGLARFELGEHEAAAEVLTELVKKYRDFEPRAEAELCRARALAASGKTRAARAALDAVLAHDKGVFAARARIERGLLHVQAGEHEEALSEFLKVSLLYAFDEEVARATWLAGRCLEAQGELDMARKQYRTLVTDHAESAPAEQARARLAELDQR